MVGSNWPWTQPFSGGMQGVGVGLAVVVGAAAWDGVVVVVGEEVVVEGVSGCSVVGQVDGETRRMAQWPASTPGN